MRTLKPDDPEVYYNIACIYSKQGRLEDALHYLEEAMHHGFNNWDMMKSDPDLENVRGAAGYKKLISSN
jgi:pentatricopeptide repeat protein